MLDAYIKCGKPEEAYLLYKQVTEQRHGLDAVSISIVVNALAISGMNPHMINKLKIAEAMKYMHILDFVSKNMHKNVNPIQSKLFYATGLKFVG